MKASVILLAGGKSSRMGTNKALLKLNDKPNIERIRDELSGFPETTLVTNEPEAYEFLGVKIVMDKYPGEGPLAGLHAGLNASTYDICIAVACDMPFISKAAAELMVDLAGPYDAVVPVIGGKQHPLFAVYKKAISERVEECLKEKSLRMKHLLDSLNVLYVDEKGLQEMLGEHLDRIFFNMNRPEEYENARRWAESNE